MSRIFSVLSVSVLVVGLASTALGMNYHINEKETRAHDPFNQYYLSFCIQDQTQAHLALPATPVLGSYNDPDTRLILYNDDRTTRPTGAVSGPKLIDYEGHVTVQSNIPGTERILSATNGSLFLIQSYGEFDRMSNDPLTIVYDYGGTLTITPDILVSGTATTQGAASHAVIQNGYGSGATQSNLGFFGGVPFPLPDTVLAYPVADAEIAVFSFATSNTLNAEGVTFSNNKTMGWGTLVSNGEFGTWPGVGDDGNLYYFYDTAIAHNRLNRSIFNSNRTGYDENEDPIVGNRSTGAALTSNAWSFTEANNARFYDNRATGSGGAVYASKSILQAQGGNTLFSENWSLWGNGGAIAAIDSALYLKGANLLNNKAGVLGGAIYFAVDDGYRYDIVVGAYENTSSEFRGNKEQYVSDTNFRANSITFGGFGSTTGTASLLVDVDRNAAFNMYDPIRVESGANIAVQIDKVGEGLWTLSGTNEMGNGRYAARIDIQEGTFQLNGGADLNLKHADGWDALFVASGSTFIVGVEGNPGGTVNIETTQLLLSPEATLRLNDSLALELIGDNSSMGSTLSGNGNLTKTGPGTLTFAGTTNGYTGNVYVREGTFAIAGGKLFATSGQFRVAPATFDPNTDEPLTKLSVVVDANSPSIVAPTVDLRGAYIEITGINGQSGVEYVIATSNTINYDNDTQVSFGGWPPVGADYLYGGYEFRPNELVATIELAWDHADPTKRHGNFTVRDTKDGVDFTIGTLLTNIAGQNLVKKGNGTLELAGNLESGYDPQTGVFDPTKVQGNTYTGGTIIEEGTLLLRHADAAGIGNSAIEVQALGTLALDLIYGDSQEYDRQISGAGKVLKQGDSIVKLTNPDNNYSGGTEIQGGLLQFDDSGVFGIGAISFTGGTLQNTSETTLTQAVVVAKDNVAKFDTPFNLDADGGMTGAGGLTKTGIGTLTLSGTNPYQGETQLKEGIVAISRWDNIGLGTIVFDGGTLQHTGADVVLSNSVRLEKDGIFSGSTNSNLNLTGTVSGNGAVVQSGDASSTLTLSGVNTYTGGTKINSGTVAIANKDSLGSGSVVFVGGTLKNTKEINGFSNDIQINSGVQAIFDVDENDMNIVSRIIGNGGLVKTGDATLRLTGNGTYTGDTIVRNGVLAVDGSILSKVEVESGAVLTGSGTVGRSVNFQDGSIYRWDFNRLEVDSPSLHIAGDVFLKNTYFQPVTAGDSSTYPLNVDGWTVLTYDGRLLGDGSFLIDDSLCPFIDIALDYDSNGQVKLVAHNRYDPRPLSDVMATSLMMAQRKMNRRAFEQVDNELRHGRYLGLTPIQPWNRQTSETARGQAKSVSKNLWGGLVGRTENLASTYYTQDQWRINSFGVQAGYSFVSTNWVSLGVTAGAEFPQLKNGSDKIDGSDSYLGLYYGQRLFGMWELKGFLGGGLQSYKLYRRDAKYLYRTDFHGDSFETNIELARPFLFGNWMLRPYIGLDMEYASQAGAVESEASAEFRSYSGTSLTQTFLKLGMDFEKRLEYGDFLFGVGYANMIGGQSVPSVDIYYPFAKKGVTSHGAELGHNVVSLHFGGNLYLNPIKMKALFLDYTAEIFCDRAKGAGQHNFAVGFTSRF